MPNKFTATTEEFDTAVKSLEEKFVGGYANPEAKTAGEDYITPFLKHDSFIKRGMRDHATMLLMSTVLPDKSAATCAAIFLAWMAIGIAIGRAQVEKDQLGKLVTPEET